MQNLFPIRAATFAISATASSSTPIALGGIGSTIRVVNSGANDAYVVTALTAALAVATVPTGTALFTCTPVLAGEDVVFSRSPDTDLFIAAITATSTTTLAVSVGEGV